MKIGMQHWVLKYYEVWSADVPGMTLTCFSLVPCAFAWEKKQCNGFFSETIVVYYVNVGRCSQLNKYMKLYEYQSSRSFIDLDPKHSDSIFVDFFSSITADFNMSSALR